MLIAIDPSLTSTGVSVQWFDGEQFEHRTDRFKPPTKMRGAERLLWMRMQFTSWLDVYDGCDIMVIEGYSFGSTSKLAEIGELVGQYKAEAHNRGMDILIVAPMQLKKFVTGKGTKVEKAAMMLACYKRWGAEFEQNDMCDAFCLGQVGMAYLGETECDTQAQEQVIEKLKEKHAF